MESPNSHLTLSDEGAAAIKLWEHGRKPALTAYDDGTGTWTIGWGATEGVKRGMKISHKRADEMFDDEIKQFIDAVHRLIKREISQGLFDALVSFFYNNGWGKAPTLIRRVNEGHEGKIRGAFMLYVMAYDKRKGRKTRWPGLVSRRQKELAHWAMMDDVEANGTTIITRLPPAVEPPVVPVALRSKTFWALINAQGLLVAGFLTNWGTQALDFTSSLFGAIPQVSVETFGVITQVERLSTAAGLSWQNISFSVVFVCALVAMIRHVRDKRMLDT